jgi:uncharacterized membrane protein HdeD (DUF308 family)
MNKISEKKFLINADWLAFRSILCLLGGVLLWFFPDMLTKSVVIGVGVLLIVAGVVSLLLSYSGNKKDSLFYLIAAGCALLLALGLVMIIKSEVFIRWFVFVVGIIVVALAVLQLIELLHLRKYKSELSVLTFLSPILLLALGVLVIIKPTGFATVIGYFAAAALIYYGILGLILAFLTKKAHKAVEKRDEEIAEFAEEVEEETTVK